MEKNIISSIDESIKTFQLLKNEKLILQIEKVINKITKCLKNKGKIIFCGNGGSAAHAQHFAAEYVSKFEKLENLLRQYPLQRIHQLLHQYLMILITSIFFQSKLKH